MTTRRIAALFVVCVFFACAPAFAQESSWGVSASMVPTWTVPSDNTLVKPMFGAETVDISRAGEHSGALH